MGGGGLMQLVAYGAQDIYLTGKPQITFFKSVYRRYTNFAIESIQQDVLGTPQFGNNVAITISRNGDLLKRLWIEYSPYDLLEGVKSNLLGYTGQTVAANIGHAIIDSVSIEIGGQIIDRHYGKWLTIWNYLTESNPTGEQGAIDNWGTGPGEYTSNPVYGPAGSGDNGVVEVYPRPTRYNRMAYTHRAQCNVVSNAGAAQLAWVPLQFWFCRNPGLAIPLIALQYHEIKLFVNLARLDYVRTGTTITGNEFRRFAVYADFVYLDTTERRQMAQNSHEYLIDQLQVLESVSAINIKLPFNHPVKELIWAPIPLPVGTTNTDPPDRNNIIPGGATPNTGFTQSTLRVPNTYTLVLNGTNRFNPRDITYFTRNQVWEAHTGFGSVIYPDCVAVYSFALKPEENQPSGTCNFSRIDNAQLIRSQTFGKSSDTDPTANPTSDVIDLYAVNYNLLRISSGMGGIAYSN
jgi:hypothetical protein